MRLATAVLVLVSAFSLGAQQTLAQSPDWNQWRGPQRDSQLAGAEWPDSLQGKLTLVWEHEHEPSYSGPIVQGDLVFTTETVGKKTERVTAYDLKSGEMKWQAEWPGSMAVPFFAAANGDWIRSTPTVAENRLVVLGMRDVLVCLDPQSGSELWRVDFPAAMGTPLPSFGAVCSPIIDNGSVYVQTGGAFVKLALDTGEVIWQSLQDSAGMMSSGAFSSPVIATVAGVRQLVVQTRQELCGVDIETGNVMWRQPIEAFRGMNILTPLVIGDRIFTSAHSGKAQLFEVTRNGDQWSIEEVWVQKAQAYMSSPVVVGDSIYLHMKNERFAAMSVSDGSVRWTSSPMGKYWSMVSNGDEILSLDNRGELRLINASPESFDVVDRLKVAKDSWAHIAVQGDLVIVRDLGSLKVFRWQ